MGLQAVPEKKRIQSSGYSSEQYFWDWQLQLVTRELDEIKRRYEIQSQDAALYPWDRDGYTTRSYHEILEVDFEEYEKRKHEYQMIEEKYTECCIRWYETWMNYEDAFHSYHDER